MLLIHFLLKNLLMILLTFTITALNIWDTINIYQSSCGAERITPMQRRFQTKYNKQSKQCRFIFFNKWWSVMGLYEFIKFQATPLRISTERKSKGHLQTQGWIWTSLLSTFSTNTQQNPLAHLLEEWECSSIVSRCDSLDFTLCPIGVERPGLVGLPGHFRFSKDESLETTRRSGPASLIVPARTWENVTSAWYPFVNGHGTDRVFIVFHQVPISDPSDRFAKVHELGLAQHRIRPKVLLNEGVGGVSVCSHAKTGQNACFSVPPHKLLRCFTSLTSPCADAPHPWPMLSWWGPSQTSENGQQRMETQTQQDNVGQLWRTPWSVFQALVHWLDTSKVCSCFL